ncbi:MAG: hypothetical protein JST63_20320 [Bacteroidetes bacterium]|nr:hypothetical protein [Bacteroidota bacterium]
MSYLLYRFNHGQRESSLQYVKEVKKGKIVYTRHSPDAKRFTLLNAILLSCRFRVSWIHEKYSSKRMN